jgi:1-acyl-sn-glycerol-3-phosphate acyltransferase
MIYRIVKLICSYIFLIYYGWKIEGEENIPRTGGVIVCCNHISLLDPPLVGCAIQRDINFMAKSELFTYPVLGSLIKKLNAFPVKRGKPDLQAIKKSLQILKNGSVLGIFPEGSRGKTGEIRKGEPGTALIAIKSGAKVVPTAISGYYGFRKGIRIRFGTPLTFNEYKKEKLTQDLLENVTEIIMERIESLKN